LFQFRGNFSPEPANFSHARRTIRLKLTREYAVASHENRRERRAERARRRARRSAACGSTARLEQALKAPAQTPDDRAIARKNRPR
jgi:hypothetical protein